MVVERQLLAPSMHSCRPFSGLLHLLNIDLVLSGPRSSCTLAFNIVQYTQALNVYRALLERRQCIDFSQIPMSNGSTSPASRGAAAAMEAAAIQGLIPSLERLRDLLQSGNLSQPQVRPCVLSLEAQIISAQFCQVSGSLLGLGPGCKTWQARLGVRQLL